MHRGAPVGEEEVHLRRGLGAGGELEDDADAVDRLLLAGVRDVEGGRDERYGAGRGAHAQAAAELAVRAAGQVLAVHVRGAAVHRGARVDVLRDGVLHEMGGRDHGNAGAVADAAGAAEVVHVGVGVDQAGHGPVAPVVAVEPERCGGALRGDERVDDDDAAFALHEGHVGQIQAAYLVNAVGDLEQPLLGAQLRLPPQARVRGVRAIGTEKGVGVEIPDDPAVGRFDQCGGQFRDEAALGVVEVRPVMQERSGHVSAPAPNRGGRGQKSAKCP